VRRWHPEEEIGSYNDALRAVLRRIDLDTQSRNVLVTHQFVTGASRSDSEDLSVGGADNVDAALFEAFDYVALGHLHAPQSVGRETLRYCGTPLKYSFSEAGHQKSVTVAELSQKGVVTVRTVPLTPKRELSELRGSYMELTARSFYEALDLDAYYRVTLTDEEDIPDAVGKLRSIYPNIMKLEYDNTRTRLQAELTAPADAERKTPLDLFSEFYEKQNNRPLSQEQSAYVKELMESIWEGAL
jgi:exonuclease SbcD